MYMSVYMCVSIAGTSSTVHVYEFQPKGQQSDSYLLYSKNLSLPPLDALTFCVRIRFYFLWEVSGFLQVSDDSSGNLVPTIQAGECCRVCGACEVRSGKVLRISKRNRVKSNGFKFYRVIKR